VAAWHRGVALTGTACALVLIKPKVNAASVAKTIVRILPPRE
jgi:hypothetical protein